MELRDAKTNLNTEIYIVMTTLLLAFSQIFISFFHWLQSKKKNIPWKSILTSVPVYAIIVVLFASDWAFLFMGTFVPTDVFQFNTGNVSIINVLIFFIVVQLIR